MGRENKLNIVVLLLASLFMFSCNMAKHVPRGQQLLKRNIVQTDKSDLDSEPIYRYIKQKENTKTALIFNFHLWFYNFSHEKPGRYNRLKDWFLIYKLGDIVGEPPVILDTSQNDYSVKQIEKYLVNKGYYHAQVKDSVFIYGRKKDKAKVYYKIKVGQPYRINKITRYVKNKEIRSLLQSSDSLSLLKKGGVLDVDVFQKERLRITMLLKNNGYFLFSKEFIYYEIDTLEGGYKANVRTIVQGLKDSLVHKKYSINQIRVFNDFNPQMYLSKKQSYFSEFDSSSVGSYLFYTRKKNFVKPKVVINSCFINKGDLYSDKQSQLTFQRLSSLNQYQLINFKYKIHPQNDSLLDVDIQLTPFSRYSHIPEIEGTNSSGNLGLGGRWTYNNRSLFRGAEVFKFSVFGKFEAQNSLQKSKGPDNLNFNSLEFGANASLHIPKFFLPNFLNVTFRENNPQTVIDANLTYKDRKEYNMSVWGMGFGYFWTSKHHFQHQLKPIDVSAVKVYSMSEDYKASIQNTYLEKSFEDYLISSINYTLYYNIEHKRIKKSYLSGIFNIELSGNLLNIYNILDKPDFKKENYYVLGNKYAQYWRSSIDLRYNHILNERNRLIYRFYMGIAIPYGNSTAMPYVKQFSSGGSIGMRAWPVRSLGPGTYYNESRKYYNEQADFKLEANLEYRFKLFWLMEGALFVDMGNIWALNEQDTREGALFKIDTFYDQLAVGSGVGLRFDFSFFVLRIDYGIKLRDPKEPKGDRWIVKSSKYNPFNSQFSMFNFGIGYPF